MSCLTPVIRDRGFFLYMSKTGPRSVQTQSGFRIFQAKCGKMICISFYIYVRGGICEHG
nr:MAG TPA: hypothetical protein [Caudoviricetes sp.]